jgi:chromosome partitioning protein
MLISITSFKGGVGKTTTAVHLAEFFNTRGKSILIDADPNESALAWLERGQFSFPVITEPPHAATTEHLIVDTQARPTIDEIKTLSDESDLVLIPTTPDVLSIDALLRIVGTLRGLKAENYLVVLTQTPPRSYAARDARELLIENGVKVCKSEIRRRAIFAKAALVGTTVKHLKGGADGWNEYNNLGKEITKYGK